MLFSFVGYVTFWTLSSIATGSGERCSHATTKQVMVSIDMLTNSLLWFTINYYVPVIG